MTGFTTWLSFFSQRSTSTNVWDFLRLCQAPRREFGQAYMILMDWVEGAKIHPHLMFSLPGQLTPDPHIFKMEAGNWSPHDVNVTIQRHENTLNNIKYISYIIICYILHYIPQTSVWVSMFGFLKGGNDWSIGGESFCSTRMRFHQESFWEWIPSPGNPWVIHGQALADGWAPGTKRIGWLRLQSIPRYFHGFAKIEQQLKY